MYTVEFYENDRGVSELWDFLEELRIKSASNKDARIQYKQIVLYIQLLQDNGTRLSENVTKHLMDGIWELRPGNNRVFYFCWRGDRFGLGSGEYVGGDDGAVGTAAVERLEVKPLFLGQTARLGRS